MIHWAQLFKENSWGLELLGQKDRSDIILTDTTLKNDVTVGASILMLSSQLTGPPIITHLGSLWIRWISPIVFDLCLFNYAYG